ncbi:uncharacterized protein TNCV_1775891 [Trichonephila clavipes]|nr:uncharacterized protein TNCV_1775891 [Trichonephila clavipes]
MRLAKSCSFLQCECVGPAYSGVPGRETWGDAGSGSSIPVTPGGSSEAADSLPSRLLGKGPTETYSMLVCVYEDLALFMKYVYEWLIRFREGRESVSDIPRCKRLSTSIRDKNIEKVSKLITKNRRLTVRMIAG